jgi:predicted ATPase
LQYLFFIGSYRDNEVGAAHPLQITLAEFQKQQIAIARITLEPLNLNCIAQIIAETLYSDATPRRRYAERSPRVYARMGASRQAGSRYPLGQALGNAARDNSIISVQPLAKLVMQKTRGNPFFVNQFLKTLHSENLIVFDLDTHSWQWDLAQIEAMDITDNVVELIINQVKKLPTQTQKILCLAACIGSFFDLNTLSIVCQQSPSQIFTQLLPAVRSSLILPLSELDWQLLIQDYKFSHDRIQQATYALIEASEKATVHLQIGRLLLAKSAQESEKLFKIVDHFNLSRDSIADNYERLKIANLNLQAGQKAKQATAYSAALKYLTTGIGYLHDRSWIENYQLTFALYQERSELEYLNGNYEQSESLIQLLLSKANSSLAKADLYNSVISLYTILGRYSEALNEGRKARIISQRVRSPQRE